MYRTVQTRHNTCGEKIDERLYLARHPKEFFHRNLKNIFPFDVQQISVNLFIIVSPAEMQKLGLVCYLLN